jgi:hypothetical protein
MVPIHLDHTFTQYTNLHLHSTLFDCLLAIPTGRKHSVINMGRYNFYDESPNEFSKAQLESYYFTCFDPG